MVEDGVTIVRDAIHSNCDLNDADSDGALAVVGEFDIFSSEELAYQIEERARKGQSLCLDFTRCTYIDTSVLTLLVRAAKTHGDRLQMIVPAGSVVARILSITQLDRVLPIV